jgi:hypothetical protein
MVEGLEREISRLDNHFSLFLRDPELEPESRLCRTISRRLGRDRINAGNGVSLGCMVRCEGVVLTFLDMSFFLAHRRVFVTLRCGRDRSVSRV